MARRADDCDAFDLDRPAASEVADLGAAVGAPLVVFSGAGRSSDRHLGPARVVRVSGQADRVFVTLGGRDSHPGAWARVAIAGSHTMSPGDEVLVIGDPAAGFYVIGVLWSGAVTGDAVRRPSASPLRCEYDEATNKARLVVDGADLELVSSTGSISFVSGKDIRMQGDALHLEARSSVSMTGDDVRVSGERGAIALKQATYTGQSASANVGRLQWIAERVEGTAGVVIERAKDVYRTIERLSQTRAWRVRMLVASTFRLKAASAFVKADEDYKVSAERIDLG